MSPPEIREERQPAVYGPAGSVPVQLTSFVGRSSELTEIERLLASTRLLTLAGPGGCGKTRLTAEAAAETGYRYDDGVWWVDLEAVGDPDRVSAAALAALGIRSTRGRTSIERVCDELITKKALVVLDNCEHVLDACAQLVDAVLRACPLVQVVATSREPLGVHGEVVWKVPPLTLPGAGAENIDALMSCDAFRLFVERARSSRPELVVSDQVAHVIAQICERVDGLPLAIELAAARMRVMTARQILDGLEDRFRLLTGGVRTAMARQQTLQASVEWSYELLEPHEQVVFRRLSVFAGWFTLDAARAICTLEDVSVEAILDHLSQLVDKSMVSVAADERSGRTRYHLLETMRQFGRELLIHAGETEALRHRHLDYYLRLAERFEPDIERSDFEAFAELESEHDNLRAALEWGLASDRINDAFRLEAALALFWTMHGHYSEATGWIERTLAASGTEPEPAKAAAQWGLAHVRFLGMDGSFGYADAAEAVAVAEQVGDERAATRARAHLAMLEMYLGSPSGDESVRAAIGSARASGDAWLAGALLTVLAFFGVLIRDEFGTAQELLSEIDGLKDRENWTYLNIASLMVSGVIAFRTGHPADAVTVLEEALRVGNELGDPALTILVIDALTDALDALGRFDASRAVLRGAEMQMSRSAPGRSEYVRAKHATTDLLEGRTTEAHAELSQLVDAVASTGLPTLIALVFTRLGQAELALGRSDDARAHLDQALTTAKTIGMPWMTCLATVQRARLARTGSELAEAEDLLHEALAIAVERGLRPMVVDCLEGLGGLATAAESYREAARSLGAAQALRSSMQLVRPPLDAAVYDSDVVAVRTALGEDAFVTVWDEGCGLSESEAAAYARRGRGERKRPSTGWESLTPAELQVVGLAAQGLSNPEIGKRLFISLGTVKTHLSHVYAKLGIKNRAELAVEATRRGVLEVS